MYKWFYWFPVVNQFGYCDSLVSDPWDWDPLQGAEA